MSNSYYKDAYTRQFEARVVEATPAAGGRSAIVLHHTYFYPTSGGQPHDTGTLNQLPVTDVSVRSADQAIVHLVENGGVLAPGQKVRGEIDWARRFDHMQQHTGQHILSRAFIEAAAAETTSFHLGTDACTIDLALDGPAGLPEALLEQAEDLANGIVWENRLVTVRFADQGEAGRLPVRRLPDLAGEQIRLIDIDGFDLNACGGTHVAHTGEVGLIKITGIERRQRKTRIEFRCGRRALADHRVRLAVIDELVAELTTAPAALLASVQKLKGEARALRKRLRATRKRLMDGLADRLWSEVEAYPGGRLLTHVLVDPDGTADDLQALAAGLMERGDIAVFLGLPGQEGALVFRRCDDLPGHMGEILRGILPLLDTRAGGGGANAAQAGGFSAEPDAVAAALAEARARYVTLLS